MHTLLKTIQRIMTQRRQHSRTAKHNLNRIRKAITAKSGKWEGTRVIREIRDAR